MDFSTVLNAEQQRGVETESRYVRVIAGAGSGKTRVLTYRIAHMIRDRGVLPYQILAVTFTNKAAKEIKSRVLNLIEDERCNLFIGTIHSWCAFFLRREAGHIGYPSSFSIIDDEDQLAIMKEIFSKHGYPKTDPKIKQCLNWIGAKKTDGYQYEDVKDEDFPNSELKKFTEYFGEYTDVLRERKSLDFDDLLLKSIQILSEHEEVRNRYASFYRQILIDEFQDINDVQFHLIRLLMNAGTSLYVVGDPDQTIYTWRGANNRIILDLDETLKEIDPKAELETIILDKNYRSTKLILDCANRLIVHNSERVKKDLVSVNGEGEKVSFFNARTLKEETHHIVSSIVGLHRNSGVRYRDIAVLYRSNYLTRELESTLLSYRVPYRVYGGQKFFQRKEIKDIVAYFRLILNDYDDTSFDRIVNVPRRGIGPGTLEKISRCAEENGQTKFSYISENINTAPVSVKQKALLSELTESIRQLRKEVAENSPSLVQDIHDFIATKLDYYRYLEEEDGLKFEERKENVEELFESMRSQMADSSVSFEEFVESAVLQSSQDEVVNDDFVTLMTVHTAKGLEYDYVYVYSLGQGIFPSIRAISESKHGIEEERRLAYVAFTRAKKQLFLSSNQDYNYSIQGPLRPSQFIKESGIQVAQEFTHRYYDEAPRPYAKTPPKPVVPSKPSNGITDWKVGDRIEHEKFGRGVVVEVIAQLIVVRFDDETLGKKTLLGTHGAIKRI